MPARTMPKRAATIAALVLAVVAAGPVSADHGYWPEAGVTPATVSGHRAADDETSAPGFWGVGCAARETTGPRSDVYGVVLDADYRLAVILAGDGDGIPDDNEWFEGAHGTTIFENPRKGEFLWADADGDGRYATRHEADARLLIVCPGSGLPATDTTARATTSAPPNAAAFLLVGACLGVLLALVRRSRLGSHQERTSGAHR